MKKKIVIGIIAALLVLVASCGGYVWHNLKSKAWVKQDTWIYVKPYDSIDSLSVKFAEAAHEAEPSLWLRAALRISSLGSKMDMGRISGAFLLKQGMPVLQAVRVVALNMQTPVRLTFIGQRTVPEVAGRMALCVMADSMQILNAIYSPEFLAECGTDSANVGSFLLPDTYEVYWNISPQKLTQRMLAEYHKFWNGERLAKASALNLSPRDISIVCSIAEEETADRQERGVVARLYWNRLQRGMLLQADPTVKYAVGDFTLRRILNSHLEVESPYNTYRVAGLPPGPIRVVEKRTIDAMLNSKPHPYIYMCAKEDFSGLHNFATTLAEHNRNAARYHNALSALGKKKGK